jgi:hypothetical protein
MVTKPLAATQDILSAPVVVYRFRLGGKFKLTSQVVRPQILRIWPRRNAVVAIPRLRISRCATEDEICVVAVEMAQAMVVAVQDNSVVCYNNIHQRFKICLVGCGRAVWVVELEEFPRGL